MQLNDFENNKAEFFREIGNIAYSCLPEDNEDLCPDFKRLKFFAEEFYEMGVEIKTLKDKAIIMFLLKELEDYYFRIMNFEEFLDSHYYYESLILELEEGKF